MENLESTNGNEAATLDNGQLVDFKTLQHIYNTITGGKETLSKSVVSSTEINIEDLVQLNAKIEQTAAQYSVRAKNCKIVVYYSSENKETFSSFSRFKLYDTSHTSSTENVNLEYNFLIKLPQMDQAKSYTISIDLHSRVGILSKKKDNQNTILDIFYTIMGKQTANYSIEYVDYAVARSFDACIDSWFNGLHVNENSFLNRMIYFFYPEYNTLLKYLSTFVISAFIVTYTLFFLQNINSMHSLAIYGVISFSLIFISSGVAHWIGYRLNRLAAGVGPLSIVCLNVADKKLISEFKKNERSTNVKMTSLLAIQVMINLLSSYLFSLLAKFIS